MKELKEIQPVSWIKFTVYGLLLLGIYHSSFKWLITKDWEREAYSYCWLIPPVVLFLIWTKREELKTLPSNPSWAGLIPVGVGIIFYWLGELGAEYFTQYVSFWLILVGICLLHLGWQKLKIISFAIFFILTMFPVPNFVNTKIMLQLRLISSKLGVGIIQLWGLPAYQEGNIIDLGFTQLQVVEACSGLHSLISLIVLALLIAYFFKDHIWKRGVLFMSCIPLAIVTNGMRIAITGILYKHFGVEVAEGFFHGFSGWLIFVFCIPILLVEMKVLEKLPPSRHLRPTLEFNKTETLFNNPGSQKNKSFNFESLRQPIFIILIILLGSTLALSDTVDFRESIPVKKNLDQFPLEVGDWKANRRQTLAKNFLDVLGLTEYVIIDYLNRRGKEVNFYVAYYESQSKGESIHSPATCLPGSGWTFDQSGLVTISEVPGHNEIMQVNRAVMQMGSNRQLSYYWFLQRGRILTNAYQLKIFNFWDALTKHRTDGALVRLITPVYQNENLDTAEMRLITFVRDIVPVLEEYIPGKEL